MKPKKIFRFHNGRLDVHRPSKECETEPSNILRGEKVKDFWVCRHGERFATYGWDTPKAAIKEEIKRLKKVIQNSKEELKSLRARQGKKLAVKP